MSIRLMVLPILLIAGMVASAPMPSKAQDSPTPNKSDSTPAKTLANETKSPTGKSKEAAKKEAKPSVDLSILPEGWEWADSPESQAKQKDAELWHAPMAKGEYFRGSHAVIADEAGSLDLFWNLRNPDTWRGQEVWSIPASPDKKAIRRTFAAWPSMHKPSETYRPEWKVIHSPFNFSGWPMHLRFRRTTKDKTDYYSTELRRNSVENQDGVLIATLPNLSDSPRARFDDVLFRIFPGSGVESHLQLWRWVWEEVPSKEPAEEKKDGDKEAKKTPVQRVQRLRRVGDYQPEGFNYLSRPVWLADSVFALVRSKDLLTSDFAGKARPSGFKSAELVIVTINADKSFETKLIASDFDMPAEAVVTPLQGIDVGFGHIASLYLMQEKGEERRIVEFTIDVDVLQAKEDSNEEKKEEEGKKEKKAPVAKLLTRRDLPWTQGLRGYWVEMPKTVKDHRKIKALIGKRIAVERANRFAFADPEVEIENADSVLASGYSTKVMLKRSAGNESAQTFQIIGRTRNVGNEDFAKMIIPRSYGKTHSEAVKSFEQVFAQAGAKRLRNMVLAYQSEFKLDSKEIKNKQGTMLEIWSAGSRRSYESLRTEDNLDNTWQVRSLVKARKGDVLYQASDKAPKMTKSRLKAERLANQLQVRRLLMLHGLGGDDQASMRYWAETDFPVSAADGSVKNVRVHLFVRHTEESYAIYAFPVEGEDRDPVAVELEFQLGKRRSRVRLMLSKYTTIPDLANSGGAPLRIPSLIEAKNYQSGKTEFTLRLLTQIKRQSFESGRKAIRSGYNWNAIGPKDFSENFKLED